MKTLENRFYYLDNFHTVVTWIGDRYTDLLDADEASFVARFPSLPQASRALLVRMIMRKGEHFRSGKLRYEEIGDPDAAAAPLAEAGWIDAAPTLSLEQLFTLLTRSEIESLFGSSLPARGMRKSDQYEALRGAHAEARRFGDWHPASGERVYQLRIGEWCDRLRLMFFGNLRQDWTEFVLADLGIYRYETVALPPEALAFRTRADVDGYLHLFRCRERFEAGEPVASVLADLPPQPCANDWLEQRRARLLFQLAQHCERLQDWDTALRLYGECAWPGARVRRIRVMEHRGETDAAFALAQQAASAPESEAEAQQLARMLPRLRRTLGLPKEPAGKQAPHAVLDLRLPPPAAGYCVEEMVRTHIDAPDAPARYVENTLLNSLFGLLCWQAIFMPVPGAFFHPFHAGPADLHSHDFRQRRAPVFDACLSALESERYLAIIRRNFRDKQGLQSPFVYWETLDEELLELALLCIPARHLRLFFERMLLDLRANRSGLPDLIQFWPRERRYRMIEVKAPGDRLQDNQLRWLAYCGAHGMPVEVCFVQWQEEAA